MNCRTSFSPFVTANTYSICAVDPQTGEAGVAVASRAIAVGALVPFAAPGVGAMAVQGCVSPEYAKQGMEDLANGGTAPDVLARLIDRDLPITDESDEQANSYFHSEGMTIEGEDFLRDPAQQRLIWKGERIRQVGIVDGFGNAVVHSGVRLQIEVASRIGEGVCCQGNALTGSQVVDDMLAGYEKSRSDGQPMDVALMNALVAGEQAGGDKRGTRAAALLVVRHRGHWTGSDRYRDLRVDDDDKPVDRLAKLFAQF